MDPPKLLVCIRSAQVTLCMRINHSNYALLQFRFIVSLLDHRLPWEEKDIFSSFVCLIYSRAFHRRGADTNLLNE